MPAQTTEPAGGEDATGGPPGEVESSRPTAEEIYHRVCADAYDELERSPRALGLSALFAGFTLGATALVFAAVQASLHGGGALVVAALVYPVGYVAVIVGRAQLFTENTLYPVMVCFEDRGAIPPTARLWLVVLAGNIAGALIFALVAAKTSALPADVAAKLSAIGDEAVSRPTWHTFWSAVLAGWVLALVAWLVEGTDAAIGTIVVVWMATFVVGLLQLDHTVASAVEAWSALLDGRVGFGAAAGWEAMTVAGNAVGGVFIVSIVNYGQVRAGER